MTPTSKQALEVLPEPLRAVVEQSLAAFFEHTASTKMLLMFDEMPEKNQFERALVSVWAASDFVSGVCTQDPETLMDLIRSGDLMRRYEEDDIRTGVTDATSDIADEAEMMKVLRRIRKREVVRIAFRDLAGWAELEEVTEVMSALADACLQAALDFAVAELQKRFGTPMAGSSGKAAEMSVFGLGKLGGRELNFSSDIDLIFAYSEDGETNSTNERQRHLSNHEFFLQCGRSLIKLLDRITADGQVFRVDMRLRPNGDSGPLVLSYDAVEYYYQTHGREWERYALIKARVVAGDKSAGNRMLQTLRPFIYRKYLDFGAFDAIREMKVLIERELVRKGMDNNIKLGRGGIREIEFIAQSFQLIHGGRETELQTPKLKQALQGLNQRGVLQASVVRQLYCDYQFLRNVEHRLQMAQDRQLHVLPNAESAQLRLAYSMGFADWNEFSLSLANVRNRVHEQFSQVFAMQANEHKNDEMDMLADIWMGMTDGETAQVTLTRLGFEQPEKALAQLKDLRGKHNYQAFSKAGRERLDRLMPRIIAALGKLTNADTALDRVLHVIQSIGRRSAYLALLIENPTALRQLVELCAASQWISHWIGTHPVILDELLVPLTPELLPSKERLREELERRLAGVDDDDLDAQMNILREFRHGNILRVAAIDIGGGLSAYRTGECLSNIAAVLLAKIIALAQIGLAPRFGWPMIQRGHESVPAEFGIIAYGKLGSSEFGYNSDLDIVFLYDDGESGALHGGGETRDGQKSVSNEYYFGRLAQRIIHILTTRTSAGLLYEVDMRLRPSGNSGTVVSSLEAYKSYQHDQAWTWEHQALVRARLVAGSAELDVRFGGIRKEIVGAKRDEIKLKSKLVQMRERMIKANSKSTNQVYDLKLDRGGMVDIEFIAQYCVLVGAHEWPALGEARKTQDILQTAHTAKLLTSDCATALSEIYAQYLKTEQRLKLNDAPALIPHDQMTAEREAVSRYWDDLIASHG